MLRWRIKRLSTLVGSHHDVASCSSRWLVRICYWKVHILKTLHSRVAGQPVVIRVVEDIDDLDEFTTWALQNPRMGFDTETTGLDIYQDGYKLHTAQFANRSESWVIPMSIPTAYGEIKWVLEFAQALYIHNASFDVQVIRQCLGYQIDWAKVTDTRIISHLVDPRGMDEGGIGHGLEALTRHYIDPEVADGVKSLMKTLAKEFNVNQSQVWSVPGLESNPDFLLYAGMDPILAVRLSESLRKKIPSVSLGLVRYEHEIARVCTEMERQGFLLDVPYTEKLSGMLLEQEQEALFHAQMFEQVGEFNKEFSVNSTDDVADAFEALGVPVKGRTPSGKRKVDSSFLDGFDTTNPVLGSPDHLATAVIEAKRARKQRTTLIDGFLAGRDSNNRVHPSINPLRARTARMSITGIPAQTLPAGDSLIRSCFIADVGQSIVSVDYKAQELRVLAALSGDRRMKEAFANDQDLHQITADAAGVDRKVGKMANFLVVYGGGAGKLAQNANIGFPQAKHTLQAFGKAYPGVEALKKTLESQAEASGSITTPTGRVLPVDASRSYSALNYMVQSTSRDITCAGLLRLDEAGYTPYLRLPVHDEILASVPTEHAEYGAREIARLMKQEFRGVLIDTDADVYGQSWGDGYKKEDLPIYEDAGRGWIDSN
jgi:DNA polymerase-1